MGAGRTRLRLRCLQDWRAGNGLGGRSFYFDRARIGIHGWCIRSKRLVGGSLHTSRGRNHGEAFLKRPELANHRHLLLRWRGKMGRNATQRIRCHDLMTARRTRTTATSELERQSQRGCADRAGELDHLGHRKSLEFLISIANCRSRLRRMLEGELGAIRRHRSAVARQPRTVQSHHRDLIEARRALVGSASILGMQADAFRG